MSLRPRTVADSFPVAAPAVNRDRLAHVLEVGHRFVQQQEEVGKYWSTVDENTGKKTIQVWSEPIFKNKLGGKREYVNLPVDAETVISHHEKELLQAKPYYDQEGALSVMNDRDEFNDYFLGVKKGEWVVVYTNLAPGYTMVLEKAMTSGTHRIYTFKTKMGLGNKAHAYAQKSSKSAYELNKEAGYS